MIPSDIPQSDKPERHPLLALLLRFRVYLASIAVIAVFGLMTVAAYNLTNEVRYDDVLEALSQTTWASVVLAVMFTGLSFAALICYDLNALEYIGRKLPPAPVAMTAFSAYAIGNTAGFGALSGGAIRFRAYSRLGLTPEEIARVIAFVTLSFGIGLLGVSAVSALVTAPRLASVAGMDADVLRLIAIAIIAVLVGLMILGRNGRVVSIGKLRLRLPDTLTSSRQFLITALDIAASASVLYMLLPETNVGWPAFFAIYATAVGLGVLSHVPAGLGVFETVMLGALGNAISIDALLGSLVLYRLIYHVLPLVIAVLLVIGAELREAMQHPVANDIGNLAARLAPHLLSAFALILGAMLIFSSVTPTPDSNLDFLSDFLPLPVIEGAHLFSSLLGLMLAIAARGLGQRLDGAWWVSLLAATVAFVFAFLKGIAVVEATVLAIFIFALILNAKRFNRPASLVSQALSPAWLAAILVILAGAITILFFVYRDVDYHHNLWWEFEFTEEAPRGLRALLALTVAASGIAFLSLLRPAFSRPDSVVAEDVERAVAIAATQNIADANLVRMGDKRVMFSDSGKAFIMFGIQGRSWIALGDPIGAVEDTAELVWRFVETARAAGGRAVLYQVSPALLSYCADAGLRAFKLGELASVELTRFELKGGKLAGLRQALSKGARDGLEFSIVEPPDVAAILGELRAVSDAWLSEHNTREKTFSLGAFEDSYVTSQPVALLRKQGRVVAFATVFVTETKHEGTVDIMRFAPDAPRGSMDFLFVSLLEHLKSAGYQVFNLGMAPLSGMSKREIAPVWDRIGGTMFEHGERFYNFKGLRAFKSKFHPLWQPRYLAVSGGTGAVLALMDVTLLISGGVRGVVGK